MINKIIKICLSFVLACSLFLQMNTVNAISNDYEESVMPTRQYEYIETSNNNLNRARNTLASSYSSVDQGYVTSVKNQRSNGNCWDFAACSVAESYLIKHGITNNQVDLSEAHLNYYMYNNKGDTYSNIDNDKTIVSNGYTYLSVGADPRSVQFALSNFGLANESSYPLSQIATMNGSKTDQYNTDYILTDSRLICSINTKQYINEIKQAIYDNGSVFATYLHNVDYYNSENGSYYNPNQIDKLNHAITIVGWDDNYSSSNFDHQPSSNGAWLVKNSWGDSFGHNGYFWMSYDESTLGYVYSYEFMKNDHISSYQYDGTENPLYYAGSTYTDLANVFEVKKDNEKLKGVSIATFNSGVNYQIEIYTSLQNLQDPTSGTLAIQQSDIIDHVGVNYVNLNNEISLKQGTYYSIVIKPNYGSEFQIMTDRSDNRYSDIQYECDFSNEYCLYKSGNSWIRQNSQEPKYTYRIKGIVTNKDVLSINKTNLKLVKGESQKLIANKQGGQWASSNNEVATVDQSGNVKAISKGTTNITYKFNNEIVSCTVIVNEYNITSVSLNKSSLSLKYGTSETLVATISPTYTTDNKAITWKSSNTSIAKIDSSGKVTAINSGTATITVTATNNKIAQCQVTVYKEKPVLSYQTHVQNVGWQSSVGDGATSGTSGKSLRLEGIKISLNNKESYTGTIQYRTHVQNIGWQNWVSNGQISGTSGKSLRLETIQIQLTEELAQHYDVYYRVHAQNFGWLDWAKNGQSAGNVGYSYRLEAIQIKLVEINGNAPGSTTKPYIQRYINYRTHVQNVGWQSKVYDGSVSGTSGRSLRLEGIEIKLDNPLYTGNVEYRTHIQNIGWEGSWKRNGQMSGTSGRSLRLEAIQIQLTGEMSNHYDIYYHVHAQDFGWLGWAKNGESAGTEGLSKRLEAIQIVLVQKGEAAPGSTARAFVKK